MTGTGDLFAGPSWNSQLIFAKTVSVPARPQFPTKLPSSTPSRTKVSASKSEHKSASEAPEIQVIPYIQQPTPVIDLTASSSTSGNQVAEVPISIQSKSPSPTKDKILSCLDLIPIYSDDQSLDPKLQECSLSNLAASGCIWFSFRARRG